MRCGSQKAGFGGKERIVNSQRKQDRSSGPRERVDPVSLERFVGTVARFIAQRTGVSVNRIHRDFDFMNAGLLDSISTIELLLSIQDQFDEDFLAGEIKVAEMNTPAKLYRRYLDARSERHGSE